MRHYWQSIALVFCTLLTPALGQQNAVRWHQDLESAKVVAKETKRLLLIHFWTPSCGPCMALERNVFNQPGVAAAIEAQFVPVKLNADENSATAQWYGITRLPTDIVATPDGQIVSKMVSPPTPAAYVAELTTSANKYATRLGGSYVAAADSAPVQSQLNSAYAKLPVSQSVPVASAPHVAATAQEPLNQAASPPVMPPTTFGNQLPRVAATSSAAAPNFPTVSAPTSPVNPATSRPTTAVPAMTVAQAVPASPAPVTNYPQVSTPATAPQMITNPAVAEAPAAATQPQITPIGGTLTPPAPLANPYLVASSTTPPAATQPLQSQAGFATQAPATTFPSLNAPPIPTISQSAAVSPPSAEVGPPWIQPPSTPNSANTTASVPDVRQLPAGSPPLAFDGYCPVSMRNNWKWVPGNPQYGIVHLGRTYWFAGSDEQKQFWTDPTRYAPAMSGNDPVLAIDHQQHIPGKREHSLDYDGLFYMFASEATLQQFAANPAKYAVGVRQAMGLPRGRLVR